jgi:hypothetical protein
MNKFKKIIMSFSLGLMLSIIPITAFAATGKTFNIKRIVMGNCPQTLNVQYSLNGVPVTMECTLTGESPNTGDGVSVCSYACVYSQV